MSRGRRVCHEKYRDGPHADRDAAPLELARQDCSFHGACRSHPSPARREHQTAEQSSTQHAHHAPQRHHADIMPDLHRRSIGQRDLNLVGRRRRIDSGHRGWRGMHHAVAVRSLADRLYWQEYRRQFRLRTPRRTWLRQFHNSPRLISYRRAISAMPMPGCSVSATIRSFSSRLQRRRRSTPVIISIMLAGIAKLSGAGAGTTTGRG